ncbi:MAG: Lar family restriction alleviation protein [Candidatus Methylopumilus sp.]|jgi:hypothetical protein
MPDLLPCPFCGTSDSFVEREDFTSAYVQCDHCLARGPVECQESDNEELPGKSAAELSWNTRIDPAPDARGGQTEHASREAAEWIIVYLRNVGTEDDECWVVCAKGDPGAVAFEGCALTNRG